MNRKLNENTKTYYIKGMHCASCELLIEKEITKLKCVDKVSVSLKNNSAEIASVTKNFPDVKTLNDALANLGYSFTLTKPVEKKLSRDDALKVVGIFLLFIIVFFLFERTNFFMKLSINSSSSIATYFLFGLVASLSSCAALVGGILLSLSGQWHALYNGNVKKSYTPFLYFNISRIIAFALFGGLLGLIGSYISISIGFSAITSLLISTIMLFIGFQMLNIHWFKNIKFSTPKALPKYISDTTNFKGKYMPLLIGALTFFIPCGFTLIAQVNAITSGSFLRGASLLAAFSLGTLPVLALISFSSVKFYTNQAMAKKFNLFAGMLIIFFALYTVNAQLNVLGLPSLNDVPNTFSPSKKESVVAVVDKGIQLMQMEATAFDYYPPVFNIKVGIPTKWEIYNSGASGCAQAVYARGLYPDVIYLKPGLNEVTFTPMNKGTYKISCSMGMVPPVIVNVY